MRELVDEQMQARSVTLGPQPTGAAEHDETMQPTPGQLDQNIRVTLAGQRREGIAQDSQGGMQRSGPRGLADRETRSRCKHRLVEGWLREAEIEVGDRESTHRGLWRGGVGSCLAKHGD